METAGMDRIYVDYNCFQRAFDDLNQDRIYREALACLDIFGRAERGQVQLVWLSMHDDENALCPFPDRVLEVLRLAKLCQVKVQLGDHLSELAKSFAAHWAVSPKDALHLASAVVAGASHLLTRDDQFLRQARRAQSTIVVLNPVDYVEGGRIVVNPA